MAGRKYTTFPTSLTLVLDCQPQVGFKCCLAIMDFPALLVERFLPLSLQASHTSFPTFRLSQ